jgi:predicted permease
MESLWHDLRFALRGLYRNLGFAGVAVTTIGLGIGANTAIFAGVYQVLMRPLPFAEADRLVTVELDAEALVSKATLTRFQDRLQSFDDVAAWSRTDLTVTDLDQPERISGARVTSNLFHLLGVEPLLGRALQLHDGEPGAEPVAVLSQGLWERIYAGGSGVLGRRIMVDGRGHTILGVMPRDFSFPSAETRIWIPATMDPAAEDDYGTPDFAVVGRLAPGVESSQATLELRRHSVEIRELFEGYPGSFGNSARVIPVREALVGQTRPALLVLFGAVGFVLLIVCANVANLLLTRAQVRRREMAVRTALGARRSRVVRQLLTESVVLALLGGVAGLLLAAWTGEALRSALPAEIPGVADIDIGREVLLFTLGVAVMAGILFGLAPALQSTTQVVRLSLGSKGRGASGGWGGARRVFRALMICEVAMAMILVVGAGLMLQSFDRLSAVDPGFRAEGVLTLRLSPTQARYSEPAERDAFWAEALESVRKLPGVASVAAASIVPFTGSLDRSNWLVEDGASADAAAQRVAWRIVTHGYFETLEIPLRAGRTFLPRDRSSTAPVAVVNEAFVDRYLQGRDPLGERIRLSTAEPDAWVRVIGVVADSRQEDLGTNTAPEIYRPFGQSPVVSMGLLIRTPQDEPRTLVPTVRRAVWEIDSDVAVSGVQPMEEVVQGSMAQSRMLARLLGVFGLLALVLGAVGTYGVLSYGISQRSTEIGVRLAIGAPRGTVVRAVMKEAMGLIAIGLAIGVVGAWALAKVLSNRLHGVEDGDPLFLAMVALVLASVAAVASYIPGRRASRIDPVKALRVD